MRPCQQWAWRASVWISRRTAGSQAAQTRPRPHDDESGGGEPRGMVSACPLSAAGSVTTERTSCQLRSSQFRKTAGSGCARPSHAWRHAQQPQTTLSQNTQSPSPAPSPVDPWRKCTVPVTAGLGWTRLWTPRPHHNGRLRHGLNTSQADRHQTRELAPSGRSRRRRLQRCKQGQENSVGVSAGVRRLPERRRHAASVDQVG